MLKKEENIVKAESLAFTFKPSYFEEKIDPLKKYLYNLSNRQSFKMASDYISELSQFRNSLDKPQELLFKKRFQELILPIAHESYFCQYAFEKPRGYAGDFVMMDMIWGFFQKTYPYKETPLGKRISQFTFNMKNCKANIYRAYELAKWIKKPKFLKIASIGCGSAIELRLLLKKTPLCFLNKKIDLYDQDAQALLKASEGFNENTVTLIQGNVLKSILKLNTDYDLIYLAGLLDYFDITASQKMMKYLIQNLRPKGTLILINAHPLNPTRFWMEYVADWYLCYKEMMNFVSIIENQESLLQKLHIQKDPFGVYQYLIATKR